MTYSIIGSGAIGSALAGHFASKDIEVSLANNRGPSSLKDIVRKLGSKVKAVTVKEAASADIVILAVPFPAVPDAVSAISDWRGRVGGAWRTFVGMRVRSRICRPASIRVPPRLLLGSYVHQGACGRRAEPPWTQAESGRGGESAHGVEL